MDLSPGHVYESVVDELRQAMLDAHEDPTPDTLRFVHDKLFAVRELVLELAVAVSERAADGRYINPPVE